MRVLGIDPGTVRTGVAVVVERNGTPCVEFLGTIRVRKELALPERMREIYNHLVKVIEEYSPSVLAIETCFHKFNVNTAVKLGEARALAILAAAESNLSVAEYPPARIKLSVCGNGQASKKQIQDMVRRILCLAETPAEDAADALSVALCHFYVQGSRCFSKTSRLNRTRSFHHV